MRIPETSRNFDRILKPPDKVIPLTEVTPIPVQLIPGNDVLVYFSSDPKTRLSIDGRVSRGSLEYDVVVRFGHLYKARGMYNSMLPQEKLWNKFQVGQTRILAHHPNKSIATHINAHLKSIQTIVNRRPYPDYVYYYDPTAMKYYWQRDMETILDLEKEVLGNRLDGATPAVAARASIPATREIGLSLDNAIIYDGKRVNEGADPSEGIIAVGLTFATDPEIAADMLDNANIASIDPLGATFSTHTALVAYAIARGRVPRQVTWVSGPAAQKGLEFANDVAEGLKTQGIDTQIMSAGNSPGLSGGEHPYYVLNYPLEPGKTEAEYAGGDAGDALEMTLTGPEAVFRKILPINIGPLEISKLQHQFPSIDWIDLGAEDLPVELDTMNELQSRVLKIYPNFLPDVILKAIKLVP